MAALFLGLFTTTTAPPTVATASAKRSASLEPQGLIQSPRSYHMPAYPMASEWDERQRRSSTSTTSEGRIAHWDKKREKCTNCKHIYLKTLSRHPGFCSVDCKSNAAYIDKVNRTIKAVRNAVERQQQSKSDDKSQDEQSSPVTAEHEDASDEDDDVASQARTFAEFGLESRLPTDNKVEWAFSAMY